jgi:endonuclease YncB( thermonuclease family)
MSLPACLVLGSTFRIRSRWESRQHLVTCHLTTSCSITETIKNSKPTLQTRIVESVAKCSLALATSILLISAPPPALGKEEILGIPRIIDGDTIVVNGTRIRLFGIDAPESKQSCSAAGKDYECGAASTAALIEKVGTSPVRCDVKRKDMYGRSVAICKLDPPKGSKIGGGEEGLDLNAWLVSEGWAVSYRRYSKAYVPLEIQAQAEKKGIWSSEKFEQPEQWRKEHNGRTGARNISAVEENKILEKPSAVIEKLKTAVVIALRVTSSTEAPLDSTCLIKGNITGKGAKIYHVPGGRFYEATKIDTKAGEKYFCSEEEAVAAGWRASKG